MVELTVNVSEKEFVQLNMQMLYRRPGTILITVIGLAELLIGIMFMGMGSDGEKAFADPFLTIGLGLVFSFMYPLLTYFRVKKIYPTNKYLQETVEWSISENILVLQGETFKSEFDWSNIYCIKKMKGWVLIYKDKVILNCIPNRCFASAADYDTFWEYARKNNVKIK